MAYLPTLKQLQYLTALHQHRHFGRAAEALNVTQSTLSAGVRELETVLDTMLVERTQRVTCFTPIGEKIVAKAYVVLRETEELAKMAVTSSKPLSGELRLGVIPTIAPFLLPLLLPELREKFPDLKLYLREDLSTTACESLMRGQLDCLLFALPYACGDLTVQPLFRDPFHLAFHPADFDGSNPYVLRLTSTIRACWCSRTAIAYAATRSRPAGGRSCAPIPRMSAPRCTRWCRWSPTASASPCCRRWPWSPASCPARRCRRARSTAAMPAARSRSPGAPARRAGRSSRCCPRR